MWDNFFHLSPQWIYKVFSSYVMTDKVQFNLWIINLIKLVFMGLASPTNDISYQLFPTKMFVFLNTVWATRPTIEGMRLLPSPCILNTWPNYIKMVKICGQLTALSCLDGTNASVKIDNININTNTNININTFNNYYKLNNLSVPMKLLLQRN